MVSVNLGKLLSSAMQRKQAIQKIDDQQEALREHIIKYYMFDDEFAKQDWIDTISTIYRRLVNLQLKKGQKLTKKDFYNWLFDNYDRLEERGIRMDMEFLSGRKEYRSLKTSKNDYHIIYNKLKQFITTLSDNLEKGNQLSKSDIENILNR